ncbi:MAG: LacI family transcriptional regulator [Chloroflexi bacterium]|nr:LacI family transcriptional regulator [Chloroflexota bacterium]
MHIGIVTNEQSGVFQRDVIAGAREVAVHYGHEVEVDSRDEAIDRQQPTSLDLAAVDGVLVITNVLPDDFLEGLYLGGTPLSLISHRHPTHPIPSVMHNNAQGIWKLMDYLVQRQRRQRLLFISGNREQRDGIERLTAFQREVIRHDLPEPLIIPGDFEPTVAHESLQRLLQTDGVIFDGVLAADYLMARETKKILAALDVAVPEEVSVVGFGDGPEAVDAGLTTVAADVQELGRRAMRQLLGQIDGLVIRGATVLSVALMVRQT